MGIVTNTLVLTFLFSFSLYLFTGGAMHGVMFDIYNCIGNPGASIAPLTGQSNSCSVSVYVPLPAPIGGQTVSGSLYFLVLVAFGFMVIGAVISPVFTKFPDPWSWFSASGVFLLAFATFPLSLFNETGGTSPGPNFPPEFKMMVGSILVMCYILAFYGFYKNGGGSP